jgi:DNA-binding SARP family transcriptional activator
VKSIQSNDAEAMELAEPVLRLRLFGPMRAEDASGHSVLPRSRKTRAVLAVLALVAPKPVLRSRLTGLLWSQRGREQARGSLRQSIHELQRTLGRASGLLLADRSHIALTANRLWVDVRTPATAMVNEPTEIRVFRSVLLDDLDGLDPAFDSWLAEQRHRIAHSALSAAETDLATAAGTAAKIEAAERLLTIDGAHETAWQTLIGAHMEQGNDVVARLVFDRCTASLSVAGRVPSAATEALLRTRPSHPKQSQFRASRDAVRLLVTPPRLLDRNAVERPLPGLAEEITAAVSRFRWIACFVEERPGTTADYTLDSTVQGSSGSIRVIARVLDARGGADVIWAHRFDTRVEDSLLVQSELAAQIAAQIDPELLIFEGTRRNSGGSDAATAFDLTLRAIPAIYRLEPVGFRVAGELLAAAAAVEPAYAAAYAWRAYWYMILVAQGWAKDPARATVLAGELAERAVTLDPGDARAVALVGHVRSFLHQQAEEGCALEEKALSLNPNLPLAWCFSGLAHSYLGRHDTAIEHISCAQHLAPHDPHAFFFDMALMMPHFMRHEFDKPLAAGRRAMELNPGFTSTHKGYLATLGLLGVQQEAQRILTRLLQLEPGFSVAQALVVKIRRLSPLRSVGLPGIQPLSRGTKRQILSTRAITDRARDRSRALCRGIAPRRVAGAVDQQSLM